MRRLVNRRKVFDYEKHSMQLGKTLLHSRLTNEYSPNAFKSLELCAFESFKYELGLPTIDEAGIFVLWLT